MYIVFVYQSRKPKYSMGKRFDDIIEMSQFIQKELHSGVDMSIKVELMV